MKLPDLSRVQITWEALEPQAENFTAYVSVFHGHTDAQLVFGDLKTKDEIAAYLDDGHNVCLI